MIRRPLMYLTLSFAAGIITTYYVNAAAYFVALLFFASIFLKKKAMKPPRSGAVLIAAFGFAFGNLAFLLAEMDADILPNHAEQTGELKAEVLQIEPRENDVGAYLQIKAGALQWDGAALEKREQVLVRYYDAENMSGDETDNAMPEILPGDRIVVKGRLYEPEGRRNPGCFDYALYLKSVGVETCMTASSVKIVEARGKNTWMGRLHTVRETFLEKLEAAAGKETAAVMRGILFGGKSQMEEELLEEFQKNGTAHVLAVSGLHVGIIYGFLSALWVWRKGRIYLAFIMVFFFCYAALSSFSPSVVRAVFMVGLHVFAKLTNRRYDLSSTAFLTALLMLLYNPMHVFHTGFQMSFLAVLTLSLITPIIRKFYSGLFLASVSVQAGLFPYTVYTFNYFSAAGVLVNVPVVFLTGIIVPAGLLSMVTMALCPPLFDLISGVLFGLCRILTEVNGLTCIDGITVFTMPSPPLFLIALYYLCLLFFVSEDGRLAIMRKGTEYVVKAAVFMIVLSLVFGAAAGNRFKNAEVVFVDVGQGDCIHLRTEDGGNYLIDGGGSINYDLGKKTLKPYLLKNGVRYVDGAFVTHLHTDHYKGIAELCRQDMVKRLFLYEGSRVHEEQILKDTGLRREDITYLYKGQTVKLGGGDEVATLWPGRKTESGYMEMAENEEDENASSMILKAEVKGFRILATADVDEDCLDDLAEEWGGELEADALKVAHHGSKYSYSEVFTDISSPRYAVFQVGKNNFGHPNKGVVENYLGKGIIVYRNDENGAVAFDVLKNGSVRAMTVKGEIP